MNNFTNINPSILETDKLKPILLSNIIGATFLVILFLNFKRRSKKLKELTSTIALTRTIPRVQWTPIKLFFLDGVISLIKLRNGGIRALEELVEKYGPQFRCPAAIWEVIAISDPEIIKKLLISSKTEHLQKPKQFYDVIMSEVLKDGLLAAEVEVWSHHRRAISRAFTYNSFSTYIRFVEHGAKDIIKAAAAVGEDCSNKEMREIIDLTVVRIVTEIIMGSGSDILSENDRAEFHDLFRRGKEIIVERFHRPELHIKPIWLMHPLKWEWDQIMNKYSRFTLKIINTHRLNTAASKKLEKDSKDDKSTDEDNDSIGIKKFECLIQQMINYGLDDKEIYDEVMTFMMAGHETVVTAVDLLLFHLALNPKHQAQCRAEVDNLFENKNDESRSMSIENYSDLSYLERCILESLRITPTVPIFARRLDEELKLSEDCYIEAKQIVLVMPWVVHRNPDIYPNPTAFDPDRFLPENVKIRHSHSFLPFSMGKRNCIGWKLALLEMKVITAWILRNFEITTSEKLDDIKFMFDITIRSEKPLNMTFRKRAVSSS